MGCEASVHPRLVRELRVRRAGWLELDGDVLPRRRMFPGVDLACLSSVSCGCRAGLGESHRSPNEPEPIFLPTVNSPECPSIVRE